MLQNTKNESPLNNPNTPGKTHMKLWFSKKTFIILGVGVLVLGLIAAALMTKRLAIAFMPNTKAQVVVEVCTSNDITNFNTNFANDDFSKTVEEIRGRASQQNDINCLFIQYKYFSDRRIYTKAEETVVRIRELVNKGSAIDSRFKGLEAIDTMEQYVQETKSLPDGRASDDDGTED